MLPEEKNRLLALFAGPERWCQGAEARDAQGRPVKFHDAEAIAWDITGGMCHLFGWKRACALFGQVYRHLGGSGALHVFGRDDVIDAMINLQEYNDRSETTFEAVLTLLNSMRVWNGAARSTDAPQEVGQEERVNGRNPTRDE